MYDYIVLDTETTGLDQLNDEILQLSIIDNDNHILLNEYYKPSYTTQWAEAEAIHHITPDMVKNKRHLIDNLDKVQAIINQTTKIVGYNVQFDLGYLENAGININHITVIDDVMLMFAPIYGEYSEYWGNYKWQKLITCANYYNYDWSKTTAHNSLADCLATNYCYKCMMSGRTAESWEDGFWD